MGPTCPHCSVVYEWCAGEIEECVTAPKIYFCSDCRGMFVMTIEEVEAIQAKLRPTLDE
jgi:hypothetical protein